MFSGGSTGKIGCCGNATEAAADTDTTGCKFAGGSGICGSATAAAVTDAVGEVSATDCGGGGSVDAEGGVLRLPAAGQFSAWRYNSFFVRYPFPQLAHLLGFTPKCTDLQCSRQHRD